MSQLTLDTGATLGAASRPAAQVTTKFKAPKQPIWKRLNMRLVLLALIALMFVGYPFYFWLEDFIGGGIVQHGDYIEVNLKAMSTFDMDQMNGQLTDIPKRFRDLEGKRIALVGQMWAMDYAGDGSLKYFQLCYSRAKCCYGGPPLAQCFVDTYVKPGVGAYYDPGMVRIWGTLTVRLRKDPQTGVIKSVYAMRVDQVDLL